MFIWGYIVWFSCCKNQIGFYNILKNKTIDHSQRGWTFVLLWLYALNVFSMWPVSVQQSFCLSVFLCEINILMYCSTHWKSGQTRWDFLILLFALTHLSVFSSCFFSVGWLRMQWLWLLGYSTVQECNLICSGAVRNSWYVADSLCARLTV